MANETRRVAVGFGISYDDDIEQARAAIIDEASRVDGTFDHPEPTAPDTGLRDSAILLQGRL
ncbi:hypothetical protein [Halomarina rubra]|uniref:Uncharacterized protein n=1 Tax=Halomarina rubra TaxID=2071873 RepID=A0ABD6AYP0_9EURY